MAIFRESWVFLNIPAHLMGNMGKVGVFSTY